MIELLIAMIISGASIDFGLQAGIDYDPIECIYFATLTTPVMPTASTAEVK